MICNYNQKDSNRKPFKHTVVGCAQTADRHFKEVQNVSHHSFLKSLDIFAHHSILTECNQLSDYVEVSHER